MSEVGLIMLGFGICILSAIIFFILSTYVADSGIGLIIEMTFMVLGITGGIALMFYAKDMMVGVGITIAIGVVLAFYPLIDALIKTRGMSSEQREKAIKAAQEATGHMLLLGCDSVSEEADGFHYVMTLVWQEVVGYEYDMEDGFQDTTVGRRGTLTMVSQKRILEPGCTYRFNEKGLTALGYNKNSSLIEGGVDITGIDESCFLPGTKLTNHLMDAVWNADHKQMTGSFDPETTIGKAEKIVHTGFKYIGIGIVVIALIAFVWGNFKVMNASKSIKNTVSNGTTVSGKVISVDQKQDNYVMHLQYQYDDETYEYDFHGSGSCSYAEHGKISITIDPENPGRVKAVSSMYSAFGEDSLVSIFKIKQIGMVVSVLVVVAIVCILVVKKKRMG